MGRQVIAVPCVTNRQARIENLVCNGDQDFITVLTTQAMSQGRTWICFLMCHG